VPPRESSAKSSTDRLITPRELADAIGASESSVRRWVDAGRVKLSRTSGGHRRIPLAEAVRFIRQSRATVVRPDVLGLSEVSALAADARDGARARAAARGDETERLYHALADGDRVMTRGIVLSWYLAGRPIAGLIDGPLRAAMGRMGDLWRHSDAGVLVEHRATEIVLETLAHLRTLLPAAGGRAPVAVGGSPSGEFYAIPSLAASIILAEAGFRDINYGPNTPPLLLAAAAEQHAARLVWFSISTADRGPTLPRQLRALARRLAPRGARLVVGGNHAYPHVPRGEPNVVEMQSMAELSAFASGIVAAGARERKRRRMEDEA
jgi:MerR family transcriptional regulator, light-induced transcriptional regulator